MIYNIVRQFAYSVLSILQLAMLVRALMSWIPSLQGSQLQGFLYQITEPIIMPVRRLLWKIPAVRSFPLDLSFLLAWVVLDTLMMML